MHEKTRKLIITLINALALYAQHTGAAEESESWGGDKIGRRAKNGGLGASQENVF